MKTTAALMLTFLAADGISFAGKNNPPTAQPTSILAAANLSTPIVLFGSDPDGDPLTFRVVRSPSNGTLSGTAPNLIYTPSHDYMGDDSFSFVVSDGQFTSASAGVGIAVVHGLMINNISVTEGNSGFTAATFTISATGPVTQGNGVSFILSTIDGTAKAGLDYKAFSTGRVGFDTVSSIAFPTIQVIGDTKLEFSETFLVQLYDPHGAVLLNGGTGRCTIRDDDAVISQVGTATLTPGNSAVEIGQPVNLSLAWTHPVGWRKLDSVDLLFSDDEGSVLKLRWHAAANAFSLFNSAADDFVRTAEAGSHARLENCVATLFLPDCRGGGPPGQTATIDFALSFKPQAAGRTFSVEAFATDDEGHQQGFESVGTLTVLPQANDPKPPMRPIQNREERL